MEKKLEATVVSETDRRAMREVVERAFFALDARDRPLFASCFLDNATARYHRGTGQEKNLSGVGEIAEYNISRMQSYTATTHLPANCLVEASPEGPTLTTHAIANVVVGGRVLVRGLTYVDTFARAEGGWRIAHRDHGPSWQYDATSTSPTVTHPR